MAVSLNNWPVVTPLLAAARLKTITVPGTNRKVRVSRAAAPLFAAFLADWHQQMPARLKLDEGPVDGWTYRAARRASRFSNHASGTAVDCRYDVLKADGKKHMTPAERAVLKRILSRYVTSDGHHVLANGYVWNNCDEMHTELSQAWDRGNGAKRDTTARDVAEVIARLHLDTTV